MKVLIIEKDNTVRKSLCHFIERQKDYVAVPACSIKEGMSLFEKNSFDVVLCGDQFPDGNGLDILKELIRRNPQLISIFMTVQNDDSLKQTAIKAGIRGYLVKPFDLRQFEEIMKVCGCELGNLE